MSQKSSSKAEALAVSLLESAARKDLGEFLSMFRKDWAAKLDFTQPLTFLDAEMPLYVPTIRATAAPHRRASGDARSR